MSKNFNKLNILALIPARMGSSRFPGKPMAKILGKPMIGHVYEKVSSSNLLNKVVVATCDNEILDYINKTGGLKASAAKESIYILHPNGETDLYAKRKSIFQSSPDSAVKIYPGSVIFVPRHLDNAVPRRLAAEANASILSSLALSIASLSSLSD